MTGRFISSLLGLALLTGCATNKVSPPQEDGARPMVVSVKLYRGLRIVAGTVNQIDWTGTSFGVSGVPVATLSLFNNMNNANAFPCWLEISVLAPNAQPNSVGQLAIPVPPPAGAQPGPWPVVFDDNPPGHWSITKATIAGAGPPPVSNAQASARAAAVFRAKHQGGTADVIDGSAAGCH